MEKMKTEQKWFKVVAVLLLTLFASYFFASQTTKDSPFPDYMGVIGGLLIIFLASTMLNKKQAAVLGILAPAIGLLFRFKFYYVLNLSEKALPKYLAVTEKIQPYILPILIGGVVLAFIGALLGEKFKPHAQNMKISTKTITRGAMFIALGVVINSLRVGNLSFGGFPIICFGFVMGPIAGFIVGALTDILAFIVRPSSQGGFNIIFTLTSALTGLIPVLAVRLLGDRYPKFSFWKVLVGIIVGQMITSVILVPIFSQYLYGGTPLLVKITKALIKQAYSIPIYAFLFMSINEAISKQWHLQNES